MTTFTINNRKMNFTEGQSMSLGPYYTLPVLSKKNKNNKEIRWEIYICHDERITIITDSYYHPDGKHKISEPTAVVGKNKGRTNETTDLEQALFQAYSLWLKKKDQNYTTNYTTQYPDNPNNLRPMLANKYTKCGKKYLTEPFAVSQKLDGIRALGQKIENDIILRTRNGKRIHFLDTVKQHLRVLLSHQQFENMIVDGELYSHNLTFNEISGITRASKTKNKLDDKMQYWIFDIVDADLTYKQRVDILKQMEIIYEELYGLSSEGRSMHTPDNRVLVFLDYQLRDHVDVINDHRAYVKMGFEGLIARELDSKYEIGMRSNYLLKYKEFEDKEFLITGYTTGVGGEEGAIVFVCVTMNGQQFTVRPKGSLEKRKEMYNVGDTYINKKLTLRYQELDPITGIPRFPVGIEIRDYE
jgi:DNA ligase-1